MMGSRHDEEPLLPASLADRLREETRELHRAAERSRFVQALLRGELEPRAYALMLRSLHGLYAALESGLARHAGDPRLAAFAEPALWRREAIERDLQALAGPSWRETLRPAAAAARYVARLDALAAATQADEIMITTMVFDHQARKRSYTLLAEAFSLLASRAKPQPQATTAG